MFFLKRITVLFLFLTIFTNTYSITFSFAQNPERPINLEEKADEETKNDKKIKKHNGSENELIGEDDSSTIGRSHKFFSRSVLGAANSIDAFFGDERTITEANKTRIRIRFDFDLEQDEDFEFTPLLRAII